MLATLISPQGMRHNHDITRLEVKLSLAAERTTEIVLVRLHEFLWMKALGV